MSAVAGGLAVEALQSARPASLWRDTLRNVLRQRNAAVGLVLLGVLAVTALFADQLSVYGPDDVLTGKQDALVPSYTYSGRVDKSQAPCIHLLGCPSTRPEHLMGTDSNVRDEF